MPSQVLDPWRISSSKVSMQKLDGEWSVFGLGRSEMLMGGNYWKVGVASSIGVT